MKQINLTKTELDEKETDEIILDYLKKMGVKLNNPSIKYVASKTGVNSEIKVLIYNEMEDR